MGEFSRKHAEPNESTIVSSMSRLPEVQDVISTINNGTEHSAEERTEALRKVDALLALGGSVGKLEGEH